MKIVNQGYVFLNPVTEELYLPIEVAGRTCYKSEDKITEGSAERFCRMLVRRGHTAMLEHSDISVRFTCDRAVANEIVRHRHFSFAQESTRYVNYKEGIEVIKPPLMSNLASFEWNHAMSMAESSYKRLIVLGCKPEIARATLPLALKTEVVVKGNITAWRHFLKLRIDKTAHPQMRQLAIKLLSDLILVVPALFEDIWTDYLMQNEENTDYKVL